MTAILLIFLFRYETENGISHLEEGILKENNKDASIVSVLGNYKYSGPNREIISVVYTADENGFRPKVNIGLGSFGANRASSALIASLVGR